MIGWEKSGSHYVMRIAASEHQHVITVSEIQGQWQIVWVVDARLVVIERRGHTSLDACVRALWQEIGKVQSQRIDLLNERAQRIVRGETT